MAGDAAAKDGNWTSAEENYTKANDLKAGDKEVKYKRDRARELRDLNVPDDAHVLFFSACSKREIVLQIAKSWKTLFPRNLVLAPDKWDHEWPMLPSRIYFLQPQAKQVAQNIAKWLQGTQEVIDYFAQLEDPPVFPDAPLGRIHQMNGFAKDRTLAIFVGANCEAIQVFLDATVKGLPLSPQDWKKINDSADRQKHDWQAVNQIAKIRVILKALSGKGRSDKVTCSPVCNENTFSETVEVGENEAWEQDYVANFILDIKDPTALLFADRRKVGFQVSVDLHIQQADQLPNFQLLEGIPNQEKSDSDFGVNAADRTELYPKTRKQYVNFGRRVRL